ncbi:MAG TPA: hypothetical protein VHM64_23195 [Candidatus Binatia bacterium]|nr:hypothetical protein [Candidatus Binatia bacterium]
MALTIMLQPKRSRDLPGAGVVSLAEGWLTTLARVVSVVFSGNLLAVVGDGCP